MTRQHGNDINPQQSDLLRVCRIGRAQGLRGEVTLEVFTDDPERRFVAGSTLMAQDGRTFTVASSRRFKQYWIVRFDAISDRTSAESLRNVELYTRADKPDQTADQNAWYPKDLIGLEARMAEDNMLGLPAGELVGHVSKVLTGAAQSLLEIRRDAIEDANVANTDDENHHATTLIPFVEQLVPVVDLAARKIVIDPPPGLLEV